MCFSNKQTDNKNSYKKVQNLIRLHFRKRLAGRRLKGGRAEASYVTRLSSTTNPNMFQFHSHKSWKISHLFAVSNL